MRNTGALQDDAHSRRRTPAQAFPHILSPREPHACKHHMAYSQRRQATSSQKLTSFFPIPIQQLPAKSPSSGRTRTLAPNQLWSIFARPAVVRIRSPRAVNFVRNLRCHWKLLHSTRESILLALRLIPVLKPLGLCGARHGLSLCVYFAHGRLT